MNQLLRERQIVLENVLKWARINDEDNLILPLGWRVCISQERCAIYDQINHLNELLEEKYVRKYRVPEVVEKRIELILNKIKK